MRKELIEVCPHSLKGYDFNWTKAFSYAKLMEKGVKFPPIRLHEDLEGNLIIRNGMHRTIAAKLCGKKLIAEIATKDYTDEDFFEDLEDNYKV